MVNPNNKQAKLSGSADALELSSSARVELIRKFQRSEGSFDCCASSCAYVRVCNHLDCLWRVECMAIACAE